jgi:hypothetical protein
VLIDYIYKVGFALFRSDRRKLVEHSLPFHTARSILDLGGMFIHWLPRGRLQRFLCRYCTLWGLGNRPSNTEIDQFLASITLHSVKKMQKLFPGATIVRERFLLMTKSIVAYKTDNA